MTPIWTAIPFACMLLAIAFLPLAMPRFWEPNRNKGIVAAALSIPILVWLLYNQPIAIVHTLEEYFSFICLLASLYIISGGILVTGDLRGTPRVNAAFLAIGAVLANIIGTTGASMVLIRPFLKTNSERKRIAHLPVFFIFIVSNCGGLLTPLGDPPLFLGYLRGVPFFWTMRLFPVWLFMIAALLAIFFIYDCVAYRHEARSSIRKDDRMIEPIRIRGLINLIFLAGVLCGVFLHTPWREMLMIAMAVLSLAFGPKRARRGNSFAWAPIVEVAVIFAGIFITMVPALMMLREHAPSFGISEPWQFFWTTGVLSGILDNAPTYLTFLSIAQGLGLPNEIVGVTGKVLMAISVGAVFMGANTYIGNGPNFMVKSICEHARFPAPTFVGYLKYTILILLPLYALVHIIFFK